MIENYGKEIPTSRAEAVALMVEIQDRWSPRFGFAADDQVMWEWIIHKWPGILEEVDKYYNPQEGIPQAFFEVLGRLSL